MKIENTGNVHILDTLIKTGNAESQKGSSAQASNSQSAVIDKVELSGASEEVAKLTDKAKATSTNRAEKIQTVKEAIQSGTYNVEGKLVARAMLREHILDEAL